MRGFAASALADRERRDTHMSQSSSVTDDAMLADLSDQVFGVLPLPTIFSVLYAYLLFDYVYGVDLLSSAVAALVITTSASSYWLRSINARLAAQFYALGLALAVLVLVLLQFSPVGLALLAVIAVLTVSILGTRSLLLFVAAACTTVAVSAGQHNQLADAAAPALSALVLSALIAWLSHRTLLSAVSSEWQMYDQARTATEEARQHRGELARALKALDEAYYRLERFSVQLAEAWEAADEARRAKEQFVAAVSHELRIPLSIIIGFSEVIAISPETYGSRRIPRQLIGDVNRIYRSAQHLKSLVDDVLDLSQMDARRMPLFTESTDFGQVANEAAEMVWGLARKKGIRLVVDVPSDLPALVLDRLRIRQVLLNILGNAVRFTDEGQVSIAARLIGQEVEVTVADTGRGIAAEDLTRLFHEFEQVDPSLDRVQGSTGLGLALSRNYVDLHGGRMWAESEIGKGTTIHFTLPLVAVGTVYSAPVVAARSLLSSTEDGPRPVVLVATEQPSVLRVFRQHLHSHRVIGVPPNDLAAAVDYHMPRAVLFNELTPSRDEGEIDRGIVEKLRHRVPMITCPLPSPDLVASRFGAERYLVKPVARETLLDTLSSFGDGIRRVLVVDDDVQFAELTARVVSATGRYRVDIACGGIEGLARMHQSRPDLVLLDLAMPDVPGLGVLEAMRSDEELEGIHTIILTALESSELDLHSPERNRIEVEAPQSFTLTELLDCVESLLGALPRPPINAAVPLAQGPAAGRLARPAS